MNLCNFNPALRAIVVALGICACGSAGQRPTLPAPEFEPPILPPWDAGVAAPSPPGTDVKGGEPDASVTDLGEQRSLENAHKSDAEPPPTPDQTKLSSDPATLPPPATSPSK